MLLYNIVIGPNLFNSFLQGGQFMLNLIDFYGGAMIAFLLAIIEVSTVVFWYGKYPTIIGSPH